MSDLRLGWWAIAVAAVLAIAFAVSDPYYASVLNLISISALIASSLRFVMLIGQINFATAAFVGLGAYASGICATIFGLPFLVSIVGSVLATSAVSIVFGAITLRTKGPYFLLIGFAFTEAVRILYSKIDVIGGTSGMIGIFPPLYLDPWMPLIVSAIVLAALFGLFVAERSEFGKVLVAIRDNEDVVRLVGLDVMFFKVACFTLASAAAGLAGSLLAFVNSVISPGDFSFLLAAFALAYVKVGGEKHFLGPILGTVLLIPLASLALGLGGYEQVFYGGAIVLSVLLLPEGLTGAIRRLRGIGTRKERALAG